MRIFMLIILLLPHAAFAQSVVMPIRAKLVYCGERHELEQKCAEDERCCVFLEPAAGDDFEEPTRVVCELAASKDFEAPICTEVGE